MIDEENIDNGGMPKTPDQEEGDTEGEEAKPANAE